MSRKTKRGDLEVERCLEKRREDRQEQGKGEVDHSI
jgi:hypothetical protein